MIVTICDRKNCTKKTGVRFRWRCGGLLAVSVCYAIAPLLAPITPVTLAHTKLGWIYLGCAIAVTDSLTNPVIGGGTLIKGCGGIKIHPSFTSVCGRDGYQNTKMKKRHQHMKFSIDENQRKNLFDLCVAIVVLIVVVSTLSLNGQPKREMHCKFQSLIGIR